MIPKKQFWKQFRIVLSFDYIRFYDSVLPLQPNIQFRSIELVLNWSGIKELESKMVQTAIAIIFKCIGFMMELFIKNCAGLFSNEERS